MRLSEELLNLDREESIAMAKEGATVYATDVNLKLLESLNDHPGIVTQKLDVLDDLQIKFTIEGLPPLNVLFNCAGFVHQGTIMETHDEDWDFSFNLNRFAMPNRS